METGPQKRAGQSGHWAGGAALRERCRALERGAEGSEAAAL